MNKSFIERAIDCTSSAGVKGNFESFKIISYATCYTTIAISEFSASFWLGLLKQRKNALYQSKADPKFEFKYDNGLDLAGVSTIKEYEVEVFDELKLIPEHQAVSRLTALDIVHLFSSLPFLKDYYDRPLGEALAEIERMSLDTNYESKEVEYLRINTSSPLADVLEQVKQEYQEILPVLGLSLLAKSKGLSFSPIVLKHVIPLIDMCIYANSKNLRFSKSVAIEVLDLVHQNQKASLKEKYFNVFESFNKEHLDASEKIAEEVLSVRFQNILFSRIKKNADSQ